MEAEILNHSFLTSSTSDKEEHKLLLKLAIKS